MSFVVLQYPGIVENVEKALVTLGGVAKLSEDHFKAGSIELDYHRDNVYSRSTCSRKRRGTILIVRARRKISSIIASTSSTNIPKVELPIEVEVVGMAPTFYQFSSMFDFQYLPLKRTDSAQYESLLPKLVPHSLDSALSWFDSDPEKTVNEVDLFLPPFVFSRFTTATNNVVLCREVERRDTSKKKVAIGASLRGERKSACVMVQGQDMFPTQPPPEINAKNDSRYYLVEPDNALRRIFEERPIWTRHAISFITELDTSMIKFLLPKYGFYILSGPWGRTWCKYGYDPRTTSESRKFQTIMLNCRLQHQLNISTRTSQLAKVRSQKDQRASHHEQTQITETIYMYKSGELPPYRQMWYQICDIKLPEAEQLLQEEPEKLPIADTTYGWFRQGVFDDLREAMKADFKETLKKLDKEYSDLGEEDSHDDLNED